MPQSHVSGDVRIACPACQRVNEITVLNLPSGEPVACSQCYAPLGVWDVLSAAAADEPSGAPEAPAPA